MADGSLEIAVSQRAPITLDAALECAAGELTALVGPSGSGKTTLLRVVAGLNRPQEGYVRCAGRTWFDSRKGIDLPPQRRRVGLVFQNYALFPHLSALENVATALGHLPADRRTERARELLDQMHLSGLDGRRPSQLSGGQQQRVAVARALARDPAVLLLDEPFSAVDQVTRGKLQRELALLRAQLRIPVLLVTHDLDEARLLADRIAIMHRGTTLQSGTPDEVLLRPKSGDVARLVGLYNVFPGTVSALTTAGGAHLRWRGHTLEVRHNPGFAPGELVEWVVPSRFVLLHRRDKPSQGERENPVPGRCTGCIMLGDQALVSLAVDGDSATPLAFTMPAHAARRNGVTKGASLCVSLLAEGIHLMPARSNHPDPGDPP